MSFDESYRPGASELWVVCSHRFRFHGFAQCEIFGCVFGRICGHGNTLSRPLSLSLNVFWWTNAKLQCYIHTYWCTHPCRQVLLTFCPTCCIYSHSFFLVGLCWKSLTLIYFTSSISTSSQVGKAGPSFSFCCVDTTLPFHIVYTHLCMNNLPISLSPHQYKESAICWCVLHHSTEAIIRLAKVRPWIASLFLSFPMPLYWLRCLSLSLSFSVPSYTCVLFF